MATNGYGTGVPPVRKWFAGTPSESGSLLEAAKINPVSYDSSGNQIPAAKLGINVPTETPTGTPAILPPGAPDQGAVQPAPTWEQKVESNPEPVPNTTGSVEAPIKNTDAAPFATQEAMGGTLQPDQNLNLQYGQPKYGITNVNASSSTPGGKPNVFTGGTVQTPDQEAAEASRVAQGQAEGAKAIAAANALPGTHQEVSNTGVVRQVENTPMQTAANFSQYPDTIAGRIARQGAMQNTLLRNAQMAPGFKQAELGISGQRAATEASNVGSEMGLRNIHGQEQQQVIEQKKMDTALQKIETDPNSTDEQRLQAREARSRNMGHPIYAPVKNAYGEPTGEYYNMYSNPNKQPSPLESNPDAVSIRNQLNLGKITRDQARIALQNLK